MSRKLLALLILAVGVLLLLLIADEVVTAQDDVTLEAVGHFGGWVNTAALRDNYAFLAQALTVVDMAGGQPQQVARLVRGQFFSLREQEFNDNYLFWRTCPHMIIVPGGVLAAVIFAFNFLGDGLNEALNPQRR